jgi:SAM-dependent methyltransferase
LRCWCGAETAKDFGATYAWCGACDTLVCRSSFGPNGVAVVDDQRDFYGIGYWTHHQTDAFGFPAIRERSRRDLPERCVYWLQTLLRYAPAAGRLFEVGASHGGFLHLARLAGFEIDGVEMSPAVVEIAGATFGVAIRAGTFESVELAEGSQDVIVAFDVVEHFLDPRAALAHMRRALKPDGVLLLQTPHFPVEPFDVLTERGDRFIEQLRAPEHVYLFSRASIEAILRETGFDDVAFEPALFEYDMFLVAGRGLARRSAEDVAGELLATPPGRTVLALLDLYAGNADLRGIAAARQTVIDELKHACDERLALIEELDRALRTRN